MFTDKDLLEAFQANNLKILETIASWGKVSYGFLNIFTRGFFEQFEIFYRTNQVAGNPLRAIFYLKHWQSNLLSRSDFHKDRKAAINLLQALWESKVIGGEFVAYFLKKEIARGITIIASLFLIMQDIETFEKVLRLLEAILEKEPEAVSFIIKLLGDAPLVKKIEMVAAYSNDEIIRMADYSRDLALRYSRQQRSVAVEERSKTVMELIVETGNIPLIQRVLKFFHQLCASGKIKKDDIERVLVVGRTENKLERSLLDKIVIVSYVKNIATELTKLISLLYNLGLTGQRRAIHLLDQVLKERNEKNNMVRAYAEYENIYIACVNKMIDLDMGIDIVEKVFDKTPHVCFLLADFHRLKQDEKGILNWYNQIPTDKPTLSGEDHYNLSMFYGSQNQPEKSSAHFQLAQQLGIKEQPFEYIESQHSTNNPSQIAPAHIAIWSNENNASMQNKAAESVDSTDKMQPQNSL